MLAKLGTTTTSSTYRPISSLYRRESARRLIGCAAHARLARGGRQLQSMLYKKLLCSGQYGIWSQFDLKAFRQVLCNIHVQRPRDPFNFGSSSPKPGTGSPARRSLRMSNDRAV